MNFDIHSKQKRMKPLNFKLSMTLLLPLALLMSACEKDDPVPEIDQEVITEVTLLFTELNEAGSPISGSSFEVIAKDAEGISLGSSPEIGAINSLEAGKNYQLQISLYNDIADEDITEEVYEAGEEHQFYFLGSSLVGNSSFLTYSYEDEDANGKPIGLHGTLTVQETASNSTGTFRIILRHDLNKDFGGADEPNFLNFESAGGESDLDITFQVNIR